MRVTLIEAGAPPEAIRADWPAYPAMFETLLKGVDDGFAYEAVALWRGAALPDPAGLEAVLITGSAAGVYDDEPWMAPLMDFIRWSAAENVPQIGICFGHQAIAQALGGQVVKSDKGWGIGRHVYQVADRPAWMGEAPPAQFALTVSHQDQVITPPPGADVLARSEFTPHAALAYAQGPAISFQGHPEFTDAYARALYQARLGRPLTPGQLAAAEASLAEHPEDDRLVAGWMAAFLRGAAG